ncbi:MAG: PilZ domain-containing protein [Candidatus Omnitrophota bacterium]
MEVKARIEKNVVILDLSGNIDVNSAIFVEVVGQCLRDGYYDILCNFDEVDSLDYMGVSVIMIAYKEVINSNGRMKFVNIPINLKNIFSVAGLDKEIDIYATEDSALESFKEDRVIDNIKKMQLRRRFKRLPIDIKIEICDKYSKSNCEKADILNLSGIGAYIYGASKFKLGDRVILKFRLSPKLEEMELDAEVVWISDKQIQPQAHPGMGIEFRNISSIIQAKILDFIDKNLPLISTDNGK